jgi:uncharacterized membrane protein YqgA involved in biofilm formation
MIGTLVNTLTVLLGGLLGVVFKKHISKRFASVFFQSVGLFTLVLGMKMALGGHEILLIIFALIVGSVTGEWLKLDKRIEQLGEWCKTKVKGENERFGEGLITTFLLFCAGSMTILGSIQEGLGQGHELLFAKAMMDGFSALILATTFGMSVALTAVPLFIFQGSLTLLAMYFGTSISMPIITELTAVGGILLIGVAFSILEIKKLKVTNMLPALLFICLFVWCKIHLLE